jgi:NAD(P)H-hydrate epimerase
MEIPFVSVDQMRAAYRVLGDVFGVTALQTMENAGRNVARATRTVFLGGQPQGKRIVVLAGHGASGGAGLVAARRLMGWGAEVEVWLSALREEYQRGADHEMRTLEALQSRVRGPELEPRLDGAVVIDALLGYDASGAPKGRTAQLVRAANLSGVPILSVDVPSGVDGNSGEVHDPSIKAAATLTLGLPKRGFRDEEARRYVGDLYVSDIGVPAAVWARPEIGVRVGPIFAEHEIVRVWERSGAGPRG